MIGRKTGLGFKLLKWHMIWGVVPLCLGLGLYKQLAFWIYQESGPGRVAAFQEANLDLAEAVYEVQQALLETLSVYGLIALLALVFANLGYIVFNVCAKYVHKKGMVNSVKFSMSPFEKEKMHEDFLKECESHMSHLQKQLKLCKDAFEHSDQVNEETLCAMMRGLQSIKGLSSLIGQRAVSDLAGQMGDDLKRLASGQELLSYEKLMDLSLFLDQLKAQLNGELVLEEPQVSSTSAPTEQPKSELAPEPVASDSAVQQLSEQLQGLTEQLAGMQEQLALLKRSLSDSSKTPAKSSKLEGQGYVFQNGLWTCTVPAQDVQQVVCLSVEFQPEEDVRSLFWKDQKLMVVNLLYRLDPAAQKQSVAYEQVLILKSDDGHNWGIAVGKVHQEHLHPQKLPALFAHMKSFQGVTRFGSGQLALIVNSQEILSEARQWLKSHQEC